MTCKQCKSEIPVKVKGRGRKRTDFCKPECKKVWNLEARKQGAQVMRKNSAKKPRKPRTNYRRNERELWGFGLL